jgi:hypothetical protein
MPTGILLNGDAIAAPPLLLPPCPEALMGILTLQGGMLQLADRLVRLLQQATTVKTTGEPSASLLRSPAEGSES